VTGTVTDHVFPASVSITKTAVAPLTVPAPGGDFVHTLVIHNLSAVPATIIALTDDDTLSAGCLALISTSLSADDSAPGGTDEATCTSTGTHTVPGSYTTTANVTVSNAFSLTDSDSDSATVIVSGVLLSPTTVHVTEGGVTDTYTARLGSVPSADVTLTVAGDADCTASPLSLTFTPVNWSVPQTVTVTAVDDLLAEGTHSCTITHTASSADPDYDGPSLSVPPMTGTVTDHVIAASVSLTKTASPTSRPEPGGAFVHTLVIHNLSPVAATITALTDNDVLSAGCTALISTSLAADDSAPGGADEATCTSTGTHTTAGSYTTNASVTVTNAFSQTDTDTDGETVTVTDVPLVDGDVAITVTANPTMVPAAGGDVTYTVVVTNHSAQPFTVDSLVGSGVTVSSVDAQVTAGCASGVGTTVVPGGTFSCSFVQFVGPGSSTITVTVTDANGNPATDSVTVAVAEAPVAPTTTTAPATTAPTTTVAPTVPPTAPPTTADDGRELPATGGSIAGILLLASTFLGLGIILVRRRGRRTATRVG
jgi:hypothetical protein